MEVIDNANDITLQPGEAAIVFRLNNVHVYMHSNEDAAPASQPTQMVAIVATLLSASNRDLWAELRSRFDAKLEQQEQDKPKP
jgi:hypothetical protein